jgi:hypothetical protein
VFEVIARVRDTAYRLEGGYSSRARRDVVDDEAALGLSGELIAKEES